MHIKGKRTIVTSKGRIMAKYRLAPECRADRWLDETIITVPSGDYFVLNKAGSIILDSLLSDSPDPEDKAASLLVDCFQISQEQACFDAVRLTYKLRASGVLRTNLPKQIQKPRIITRRSFAAGMAALGASLLAPSLALGEESAGVANIAYGTDGLDGWADKESRIWHDSTGRDVSIPETLSAIAPYGPYAQTILEAICPEKIVQVTVRGTNVSLLANEEEIAYLAEDTESVADISNRALNDRTPSIIVDMGVSNAYVASDIDSIQSTEEVPIVHFSGALDTLPQTLRLLGELLDNSYANELADYVASILVTLAQGREQVNQLGLSRSVYFGEGVDGLDTRPSGTLLSGVIESIGATNSAGALSANDCKAVDAAYVQQWAPDVVVLSINSFQEDTDSALLVRSIWCETSLSGNLKTIKTPSYPYAWLGASPFVMQTLGALWLAHETYPEVYTYDMPEITSEFFRRVFDFDLPYEDASIILEETTQF